MKKASALLKHIYRVCMGFVIGASMLIPGVSGGTMAIILGIYDELIEAVSTIRKSWRTSLPILICVAAGGGAGIILLAGPLLKLVNWQQVPCMYFFAGAIIASIPPLYKKATNNSAPTKTRHSERSKEPLTIKKPSRREAKPSRPKVKPTNIIVLIIGAAIGIVIKFIPPDIIPSTDELNWVAIITLFISGIILAVALVLPGISASYILLILGMYDVTLLAIDTMNVPYLAPLGIGLLLGIFGTSKVLDNLMKRHPQFIFMLIIGFMIGSLYQIYPGLPTTAGVIAASIIAFAAGFAIILYLGTIRTRRGELRSPAPKR
jgi:putative membrane protein